MKSKILLLFSIFTTTIIAQVEIPNSAESCEILRKNMFTYCLNMSDYTTQWTAIQIKGVYIENRTYLPPDNEFFRDIPTSISSIWQQIEMQTKLWSMEFDSVFVVTGRTEVQIDSVPVKAYYKAILKGCQGDALAFLVNTKSTNTNIKSYGVSISELEALTEMDFFPSLDKDLQSIFEASFKWEFWPINTP